MAFSISVHAESAGTARHAALGELKFPISGNHECQRLFKKGHVGAALLTFRQAVRAAISGGDHTIAARAFAETGLVIRGRGGNGPESRAWISDALAVLTRAAGDSDVTRASVLNALADIEDSELNFEAALGHFRRIRSASPVLAPGHLEAYCYAS